MPLKRHSWDRLDNETVRAYEAFRVYCKLGARRSISKAIRSITGASPTEGETRQWKEWSTKHSWVSRTAAREEWLAQTADEQVKNNLHKVYLALTKAALKLINSGDAEKIRIGSAIIKDHYPPVAKIADVSEQFEDLSDIPTNDLQRMREIRDQARSNAKTVH